MESQQLIAGKILLLWLRGICSGLTTISRSTPSISFGSFSFAHRY
uniref:Uncharacterized protein n=1 Tax=Arundo donax TaxID=35708 RepID=A0A0A9T4R0_ARUDO